MRRLGADDPAPAITTPQWLPGPLEAANYSVAELLGDAEGFGWSLRVDEIYGAQPRRPSLFARTPLPRRLTRRMSYVCANLVFVERELVSGWGEVRIHISIADGGERR
jgi:hypothetical protein